MNKFCAFSGYTSCDGTFWKRFETQLDWSSAERRWAADGAHLAVVQTSNDRKCLANVVPSNSKVWTGLNDQAEEGTFRWSDGQAVQAGLLDWYPGRPSTRADVIYDCVLFMMLPGKLLDFLCPAGRQFVCQFPSKGKRAQLHRFVCFKFWPSSFLSYSVLSVKF